MRIVWHFQAAGEPRTFTVSYRFEGLAVAYDDVVDVNLKVWGAELAGRSASLTAPSTLPRPAALGPSYRVWGHPAWVNGVVARTPRRATAPGRQRAQPPVRRDARRLPPPRC